MSTFFPKGEIARGWYVVDAEGQTLGRLASRVARLLSGKDNPQYTPFLDTGSHVVIINAGKVRVTGLKAERKKYHRYTGFPGGLRTEEFRKRFFDTKLFFDRFAGAQFANYFFARHESPNPKPDGDSARRTVEEAQLIIEAVHACETRASAAKVGAGMKM